MESSLEGTAELYRSAVITESLSQHVNSVLGYFWYKQLYFSEGHVVLTYRTDWNYCCLIIFYSAPLSVSLGNAADLSAHIAIASLFIHIKSYAKWCNFFLENVALATKSFSVCFCIIDSFSPSSYAVTAVSIPLIHIDISFFSNSAQRQKLISLFHANWCLILH